MVKLGSLFDLAKAAFRNWKADFAQSMGAALAYYTVFSVAPLLIIAIAVAALIFGHEVAQVGIMDQARGMLGENAAKAIEGMLASAQKPKQGAVASTLGIVVMIIGATSVFAELESNLNRIWNVTQKKRSGKVHAAHIDPLARCLDRRGGHGAVVFPRQIPDRPLHRQERRRIELRRSQSAGRPAGVGLLLCAAMDLNHLNLFSRRGHSLCG